MASILPSAVASAVPPSVTESILPSLIPGFPAPNYQNCDQVSLTCPVELTVYGSYPNFGAGVFFVVWFGLMLSWQAYVLARYRTWWAFGSLLGVGTAFQVAGWAGRIALNSNPWNFGAFVVQMVLLILGPTLSATAVSVMFKHLVQYYGAEHSLVRPSMYLYLFIAGDIVSILIQTAGGIVSAVGQSGDDESMDVIDNGGYIITAGVAFQVINMLVCGGLMLLYWRNRRRNIKSAERLDATPTRLRDGDSKERRMAKMFNLAIAAAYVAIFIRTIFRIVQMAPGWADNEIMQNETAFLILDGGAVAFATLALTVVHPVYFLPDKKSIDGTDRREKSRKNSSESDV